MKAVRSLRALLLPSGFPRFSWLSGERGPQTGRSELQGPWFPFFLSSSSGAAFPCRSYFERMLRKNPRCPFIIHSSVFTPRELERFLDINLRHTSPTTVFNSRSTGSCPGLFNDLHPTSVPTYPQLDISSGCKLVRQVALKLRFSVLNDRNIT